MRVTNFLLPSLQFLNFFAGNLASENVEIIRIIPIYDCYDCDILDVR